MNTLPLGFTRIHRRNRYNTPDVFYHNETGRPFILRDGLLSPAEVHDRDRGEPLYTVDERGPQPWHRLVYEHFKGRLEPHQVVDHMDNDITNHRIDNLCATSNVRNSICSRYSGKNKTGRPGVVVIKGGYGVRLGHALGTIPLAKYRTVDEAYRDYLLLKCYLQGRSSIRALPDIEKFGYSRSRCRGATTSDIHRMDLTHQELMEATKGEYGEGRKARDVIRAARLVYRDRHTSAEDGVDTRQYTCYHIAIE